MLYQRRGISRITSCNVVGDNARVVLFAAVVAVAVVLWKAVLCESCRLRFPFDPKSSISHLKVLRLESDDCKISNLFCPLINLILDWSHHVRNIFHRQLILLSL